MSRFFLGRLACLLFLVPGSAYSATFYTAKTGSNSNSCAQAQNTLTPKVTINGGIGCLSSGDTLIVKSGTYNEKLDAMPSGTAWSNVTTVRANVGDTVTIKRSGGTALRCALFTNKQYIEVDGFVCTAAAGAMHNGFKLDGTSHHIRLQNMEISEAVTSGVLAKGDYHEFLNLTCHDNGSGGKDHGMYLQGKNQKVWDNDFYSNSGYGLQLWNSSGTVSDNNVQYNRMWDNGVLGNKGGFTASGSNNLIANNQLWDNRNGGLWLKGGSGSKLYNNTIYSNPGTAGIVVNTGASNTRVTNNIVFANANRYLLLGSNTTLTTNLTTDPLFMNAAADDFHLQSGSGARDTGVTLTETTDDFDKVSRPQGAAVDIGAFEYTGTSPPGGPLRPLPPTILGAN